MVKKVSIILLVALLMASITPVFGLASESIIVEVFLEMSRGMTIDEMIECREMLRGMTMDEMIEYLESSRTSKTCEHIATCHCEDCATTKPDECELFRINFESEYNRYREEAKRAIEESNRLLRELARNN